MVHESVLPNVKPGGDICSLREGGAGPIDEEMGYFINHSPTIQLTIRLT